MAVTEHLALDDAALFVCPGLPVGLGDAWVFHLHRLWTASREGPAVPEGQNIKDVRPCPSDEFIVAVAVVVSTKATDLALVKCNHKIINYSFGLMMNYIIFQQWKRYIQLTTRIRHILSVFINATLTLCTYIAKAKL